MNTTELIKRLRKDFPKDPRISGSPDMELMWKAADALESEFSEGELLRAALRRSLDWLASYPGGGAIRAYDEARKALETVSEELCPHEWELVSKSSKAIKYRCMQCPEVKYVATA